VAIIYFIRSEKTESTSIEIFLSQHCSKSDILIPFGKPEYGHNPRNSKGFFNPIPEIILEKGKQLK